MNKPIRCTNFKLQKGPVSQSIIGKLGPWGKVKYIPIEEFDVHNLINFKYTISIVQKDGKEYVMLEYGNHVAK